MTVIRVENIWKKYRVGPQEVRRLLRDQIGEALRSPLSLLRRKPVETFWALKDISFEVREGEVLGLIGRNGAGKSTLLKILSRITRPTVGRAHIRGRVGSLLEVGTGFHHELSGRENVFLNGAILGMGRREIARKFDEIVAFAEVEKFIDTPVKRYSSGMYIRLAFAVAAHLETEILFVDEVLSVGDLAFQKKCLGKMDEVAHQGRTIVFISHQMNQIRRLCTRAIWLDGGLIRECGPTPLVLGQYEKIMVSRDRVEPDRSDAPDLKARFLKWEIVDPAAEQSNVLTSAGQMTVQIQLQVTQPIRIGHHGIALFNAENQLMWAWSISNLKLDADVHHLRYTFPFLPLRPGVYFWQVSLYDEGELLDHWACAPEMIISTENHQHSSDKWNGIINVPCDFVIERERTLA
jgi:lipopolysaccharide transport system ATP-binding protein